MYLIYLTMSRYVVHVFIMHACAFIVYRFLLGTVRYRPNAARLKFKNYLSVIAYVHQRCSTNRLEGVACETISRYGQRFEESYSYEHLASYK